LNPDHILFIFPFSRPHFHPNGTAEMKITEAVKSQRIYGRALRTSEAVGNFNAGMTSP
jgi:hypothetical protein